MLASYGSIYALGHIAVADILDGEVEISEKLDGSQCSMGVINGELLIRSKNQQLHLGAENGMFIEAVEAIQAQSHLFHPNWIYRGEYLRRPKHNSIAYGRIPKNHIAIYDIETGPGTEDYLRHRDRQKESLRIGFEAVRLFFAGSNATFEWIKEYLDNESALGGAKVEGVVVKNYSLFLKDKRVARAKYVSEAFKETNQKNWKKENPGRQDVIERLILTYRSEARWQKAVQHLRDDGILEGSPRDIGSLIKAVQEDLKKEEEEAIKNELFKHFFPQISRSSTSGLPEWFKEQLAKGEI